MKFMIEWHIPTTSYKVAAERFLATHAPDPDGLETIGRWHAPGSARGWHAVEGDAVGAGGRTWRAYLSTSTVDARDRIGDGPWFNAQGTMIASDVADLHGDSNNLTAETALNEQGASPNYIGGPQPLEHDVLTGTNEDGTASDMTCNNWTDGSADSAAMLGHADRLGLTEGVNSWNAVHASQGCSMETLTPTGGSGLFYCFAAD